MAALALTLAGATRALDAVPIDNGEQLPFPGFTDMAVDQGTGRIFMTGGEAYRKPDFVSTLYVVNAKAKLVKRIDGLWGAGDLLLRPGSRSLYVALDSVGGPNASVAEVDTKTLRVRKRFRLPPQAATPTSLTWLAGRIWFVSPKDGEGGGLASLDPASGRVRLFHGDEFPRVDRPLAASPDGKLLAAPAGDGVSLFRVENGRPRLARTARGDARMLTFTPDGRELIAVPNSDRPTIYRVRDLHPLGELYSSSSSSYTRTILFPKDGVTVVGSADGDEEDVLAWRRGHLAAYWKAKLLPGADIARPNGLVLAGGRTLYGVTTSTTATYGTLFVVRPPTYVPGMPEQQLPAPNGWAGIIAGPPPYSGYLGDRPGAPYTKDVSVTNDRLEAVPGRMTIRYYLPGQAIRSMLLFAQKDATLVAADGGALLTIDRMPPQTRIGMRFELSSTAKRGEQVCNRAVLTLPSGAQHTFSEPCVTVGQ